MKHLEITFLLVLWSNYLYFPVLFDFFYTQFVGYDPTLAHPLQSLPPGANVFGILPGTLWGTSRDRLVIIGAHWDTMDKTDGYNDNGSGVAAVLEVARQIVESHCRPKNTIIFATFDLEEMGGQVNIIRILTLGI